MGSQLGLSGVTSQGRTGGSYSRPEAGALAGAGTGRTSMGIPRASANLSRELII